MPRFFSFFQISIAFILILNFQVFAGQADDPNWQEATNFYHEKKYEQALQALQAHPPSSEDPNYYYNLGTLYYQIGRVGLSIAYLEKANRLHPHDPDINYNLSIARNAFSNQSGSENLDPASSWVEKIADRASLDEVRTTLGLLCICVVALWSRAYWQTRRIKKAVFNPAGLLGIVGLVITVGIYGVQRWVASTPPAICIQKQTVQSGPGEHFVELAQLAEGTKVRLLGNSEEAQNETWHQIRYSSNGIGWIRASSLLTL